MDGYELADLLGSLPGVAPPVLVALTGYGQATDVERSRAAGFNAHIVKPVDMQELMGLLDRLRPRASTGA
jgi:CheY-like chemotaxis protein